MPKEYIPHITKFHRILQEHSVMILDRSNMPQYGIGTGVFFEYNDNFFILTACHVIKGIKDNDLLLSLGIEYQSYPMKKEKIWCNEALDIAYIQLNRTEAIYLRGLQNKPFKIGSINEHRTISKDLRHAINGFPGVMSELNEEKNAVEGESYLITTFWYDPTRWTNEIIGNGLDKEKHFILGYGKETTNQFGEIIKNKDVRGMSGAGVWLFDPKTEEDETPVYELYGIQTSWYPTKYLLRGVYIRFLIEKIKEDYFS
ncbi:MAG: hypothetical protein IAE93_05850 [Ignavibacteria bacterium]|nr:hypothetical protein [Ignavibacteria bacterium]